MSRGITPLLLAAAVLASASGGRAQETLLVADPTGFAAGPLGRGYTVNTLDGVQIIDSTPAFLGAAPPARGGLTDGFVGSADGNALRVVNGRNYGALSAGIDYIRPFWSFRDFSLTVPPAWAGAFPVLADVGHTDNHFAFVPRVQYDYYLADLDVGIGASVKFINLTGTLQRNVATAGGAFGNLVSNNSLTIVSINPVEFGRRYELDGLFEGKVEGKKSFFADAVTDLSVGARYVSLDQNYSGSLEGGLGAMNVATRYTRQNFRGAGVTAAANFLGPLGDDLVGFASVRASVVAGESRRNSALAVTAAGFPGYASTINESKTMFAPITELEFGVEWGRDLGELLRQRATRQQVTVRLAALAQHWGGMGPLSAGSAQGFRTSDLFLAGLSLQVGLRY